MRYINELHEGDHVIEHYLCKQKQVLKTRGGKTYYSLKLQDKTGILDGKIWDLNDDIRDFEAYDYVKVDGEIISYQNDLQMNIRRLRKSMEGEYSVQDFIKSSPYDLNTMYDRLLSYIEKIENPYIKKLVCAFFIEDRDFIKQFKSYTAAKNIHHNYRGGLLEHTLSVVEISDFLCGRYQNVNRDIVYATALFHDIGKIKELSALPVNDYTDDGQLIGHLIMGMEMVSKKIEEIEDFPENIARLIKHSILSHHGELEYGSPKVPQTVEAMILHCADNTDAKIKCFEEFMDEDTTEGNWTAYHRMLGRSIYRTKL